MPLQLPNLHAEPQSPNGTQESQVDDVDGSAERNVAFPERSSSKLIVELQIWTTSEVNKQKEAANEAQDNASNGQPFLQTRFGSLPPELREIIFINLLATTPPHAGRQTSVPFHLKASYLVILQTCRQIYLEAFPVFYGRTSYYAASGKDLIRLLYFGHPDLPSPRGFRSDKIATLCIKNLNAHTPVFSTKQQPGLVKNLPFEKIACYDLQERISLAVPSLENWTSLNKICLCMRVGDELGHIEFLLEIPGLETAKIDVVDYCKWTMHRDQKYQFSCFTSPWAYFDEMGNFAGDYEYQSVMMNQDSYARGVREGDERYVEVDLGRHR